MSVGKKKIAVWRGVLILFMLSQGARAAGVTVGVGFDYFPYSNFNDSRLAGTKVNESKVNWVFSVFCTRKATCYRQHKLFENLTR